MEVSLRYVVKIHFHFVMQTSVHMNMNLNTAKAFLTA